MGPSYWSLQDKIAGLAWGLGFPGEGICHHQSERRADAGAGNEHREAGPFWALVGLGWSPVLAPGSPVGRQCSLSVEHRAWPRGGTKPCVQRPCPPWCGAAPAGRKALLVLHTELLPTDQWAHRAVPTNWDFLLMYPPTLREGRGDTFFLCHHQPNEPFTFYEGIFCIQRDGLLKVGTFVVVYTKAFLNLGLRTRKLAPSFHSW